MCGRTVNRQSHLVNPLPPNKSLPVDHSPPSCPSTSDRSTWCANSSTGRRQDSPRRSRESHSSQFAIDWLAVEASVGDARSIEQAIGRAVVVADQMSRGLFDNMQLGDTQSSSAGEVPFFAFSMADVVPDFGDESRYRTRMARKVARIFGNRRTVAATR